MASISYKTIKNSFIGDKETWIWIWLEMKLVIVRRRINKSKIKLKNESSYL